MKVRNGNVKDLSCLFAERNLNICYSSDKNYAKYLALSMLSILKTKNPEDRIYFHILDGGILNKDKNKILSLKKIADFEIEFIKVDNVKFINCPLKYTNRLTKAAYYRLLLSDFIKDIDRIIYLDCDVEVKCSLAELYNMDLEDYYMAGVYDYSFDKQRKRLNLDEYFNSGVLLIDLAKLREIDFTDKVFKFIEQNSDKLRLHDQDVINLYFKDKIKRIDSKWNAQCILKFPNYKEILDNACIAHFICADKSDFIFMNLKYIFETEYKLEFLKLYLIRCIKFILQWCFTFRNKNEEKKEIILLGIRYSFNRYSLQNRFQT